jgi:hypothetical protein
VAVAKQVGFAAVEVSTLSEYDTLVVCRKKA